MFSWVIGFVIKPQCSVPRVGKKNEELLVALNGMSIPVLNDSNWANGEDQVARTGTGTSFLVSEIC